MSSLLRTARPLLAGTVLVVSAVLAAAPAGAAPPSADAADEAALERFEIIAAGRGYELIDPQCQRRTGSDAEHLCFARVGDGPDDLFVVRTDVSAALIDYHVVAEPDAEPFGDNLPPRGAELASFDAFSYFIAMFSANPKEFDGLQLVTAPGSPADAYLAFQREAAETASELGIELPPANVYLTPRGPRMCPTPESPCSDFTDIVVSGGLVETFSVDGVPIAPRLGVPGAPVTVGDTTFGVMAAYRTVSADGLAIYLEIDSTAPVALDLATATYLDRDGTQTPIDVETSIGAVVLGTNDERFTVMLAFDQADPGGTLRFTIFPDDGSPALAAHLPVDALVPAADPGQ